MEETVVDQIEDNVIEPVEDAVEAEQETAPEDVVDTPESSGETTETEVVAAAPDSAVIEAELPEAPEAIAPDAEIAPVEEPTVEPESGPAAEVEAETETEAPAAEAHVDVPVAESETEAPVGLTEAPVVEAAASEPVVAADAIIAAAEERNTGAEEPAEPEEPPVPVEILAFGFIDQNRKIHQNTTENYRGHVVGKAYDNPENQIAELEASFAQFTKDADLIESDAGAAKNKVASASSRRPRAKPMPWVISTRSLRACARSRPRWSKRSKPKS
jgi:hypothetical protein